MFKLFSTMCILLLSSGVLYAYSVKKEVFFKGGDYELVVYKITGDKDGKTALILGGIQGDEPGGFLSAEYITSLHLNVGNLYVIPRTNLKSIILNNRGISGDMNRMFNSTKLPLGADLVIEKIKYYMSKSDLFINLHDGWGFHRNTFESNNKNQHKFGQSLIVDADNYTCSDGTFLDLKKAADVAIKYANSFLSHDMRISYFNTYTFEKNTFQEMRKASTYYSLTTNCVPSFAVEASKNIKSTRLKVLTHVYPVVSLLNYYGIKLEGYPFESNKANFRYAIVRVNGKLNVLKDDDTLMLNKGDILIVEDIISDYEMGNTCDIQNFGTINDKGKKYKVLNDTDIIFRKDSYKIGKVHIRVLGDGVSKYAEELYASDNDSLDYKLIVEINGIRNFYKNKDILRLNHGDKLKIIGVERGGVIESTMKVNLKGFVSNYVSNNGDDRGAVLTLGTSKFIKRYLINGYYNIVYGKDVIYLKINK